MFFVLRVVVVVGLLISLVMLCMLLLVWYLLVLLQQWVYVSVELVELVLIVCLVGQLLLCSEVELVVEQVLQIIEIVELLVVVVLVYCGLYLGLFKYLVDFIELEVLVDILVLLVVIGGSECYVLVIDYQLWLLFSFLQVYMLLIGVYVILVDFDGEYINSVVLQVCIVLVIEWVVGYLVMQVLVVFVLL